jgi:hypothetical protein
MQPGNHVKEGDLIKAHGCIALVLEVIPANTTEYQKTPRLRILSDDGRSWVTRLNYTKWSIINEAR